MRAPERSQVDSITQWVFRIANGADLMAGTQHDVEFLTGCYNTLPNRVLSELVISKMREISAPRYDPAELEFAKEISDTIPREQKKNALQRSRRPGWEKLMDEIMDTSIPDAWDDGVTWPWSSDVGDVSWQAPTIEFSTATFPVGTSGHSWQNVACSKSGIGNKSLLFAAKTIALSVLDLMTDDDLRARAKKEFAERMKGAAYSSPIPADLLPPLHQLPPSKNQ